MKRLLYCVVALILIVTSCGRKQKNDIKEAETKPTVGYVAKGDSTRYALACEGCTDSVLVLLFDDCSDPIFYDITEARKQHRIHGNPAVGDRMAVLINPDNKKELLFAIDINQITGSWVYEAMPKIKEKSAINDSERTMSDAEKAENDSLIKTLLVPHECGFILKQDNSAHAIGLQWRRNSLDDVSPVEYPQVKRYTEWHIFNGKIIMTESVADFAKDGSMKQAKINNDTADIMILSRDTLVLKFTDVQQGYRRRAEKK